MRLPATIYAPAPIENLSACRYLLSICTCCLLDVFVGLGCVQPADGCAFQSCQSPPERESKAQEGGRRRLQAADRSPRRATPGDRGSRLGVQEGSEREVRADAELHQGQVSPAEFASDTQMLDPNARACLNSPRSLSAIPPAFSLDQRPGSHKKRKAAKYG